MANRILTKLATATALAALLAGSPAIAQDKKSGSGMKDGMKSGHGQSLSRTFSLLDTNGDGSVSLDEIKAEQSRLIGAADLNGDGKLSSR
jgi:hypothetical protein